LRNKSGSEINVKLQELVNIVKTLRSPKGCEWDKAQTTSSLIPFFIEEVYELIEGIDNKDNKNIREELGDVLLHIVFQSQIASEEMDFNINNVIDDLNIKLIDRHPHIFKNLEEKTISSEMKSWEKQKQKQKGRISRLDGVPDILPSIVSSQRIQDKASSAGFDWDKTSEVWEKLDEELKELKEAQLQNNFDNVEEEIGDVLFTIVNLSRFFGVSAENALRKSNKKFIQRFQLLEKKIIKSSRNIEDHSKKELNDIWDEVKKS
jgi:tetrapyrrole methylase family protein/MazG family protein|tara:strand:+ start:3937 stop:4725 length:789 start_codon:yes stop_codon:yes gene_type:complete